MLTPQELKRYGFQRKLKRIEQIWLDYLQDQLLMLLYRQYSNLLFRGGTCIWKVYRGDRFSEDLDLAHNEIPESIADYVTEELELLGFTVKVDKERDKENMYHLRLAINRPNTGSTTPLSLEILRSSIPEARMERREIHSPYPDIPRLEVKAISREALLAEKLAAVCDRNRPRDMHDLYLLLQRGAKVDTDHLHDCRPNFRLKELERSLSEKKTDWKGLQSRVVGDLPAFQQEKGYIMSQIGGRLDQS